MPTVADIARFLDEFAPRALAESWDNVGLLIGKHEQPLERVMTCLTITPDSACEAVEAGANLIISHHPLPFRPLNRLTDETTEGRLLLQLIEAGIAVFSPHTAFDSAEQGINQRLAAALQLTGVAPLMPMDDRGAGAGRWGQLPLAISLAELASRVKQLLGINALQAVGRLDQQVQSVGVACGSAGDFLAPARLAGCQCLVTGEMRFHTCLEAESWGMGVVLAGHFASERFALEQLAGIVAQRFPSLQVWASQRERDPLHWL